MNTDDDAANEEDMTLCKRQIFHRRATSPITFLTAAAIATAMILVSGSASAQGGAETDDEKAFYAIGAGLSNQISNLKPISDREFEILFQGMRDGDMARPRSKGSVHSIPSVVVTTLSPVSLLSTR